jgi:hypothetical protein
MRQFTLIVLFAALLQNASAQRMGGAPHFGGHFGSQGAAFGRHSLADAIPFFTDSLYSDALYSPVYGAGYAPGQPTLIIMQAPQPPAPDPVQPPAQPLLIELQGERYVRVNGEGESSAQIIDQRSTGAGQPAARQFAVREASPAVLVFRDGRSEEVYAYTITNGILYARASYYSDGSSNRRVELSSLNLPETVAANRSRGVNFQLPTTSNEVIVGP